MICEKCGGERVHWRCDNHETNTTKYKCLDCGYVMVKKTEPTTPLFNKNEINKLKEEKERLHKEKHQNIAKKGGAKKWLVISGKNYSKNVHGTWTVQKTIKGKFHYGGTYKTEEIAKEVVKRLNECQWDMSQLKQIQAEVKK